MCVSPAVNHGPSTELGTSQAVSDILMKEGIKTVAKGKVRAGQDGFLPAKVSLDLLPSVDSLNELLLLLAEGGRS